MLVVVEEEVEVVVVALRWVAANRSARDVVGESERKTDRQRQTKKQTGRGGLFRAHQWVVHPRDRTVDFVIESVQDSTTRWALTQLGLATAAAAAATAAFSTAIICALQQAP